MANNAPGNETLTFQFTEQLRALFEPAAGVLWLRWHPKPRPCFNLPLLTALDDYCDWLGDHRGYIEHEGIPHAVKASVLCSDIPGIFNLGGDLDLFSTLIEQRNRAGLKEYGSACIEVVYRNYVCYDLPLVTVSLVQGECLGGGFEAALSSQVLVAERGARLGFPEIMFNLFPGMGAVSFLRRRTDQRTADELTSSGRLYGPEELHDRGIVDLVANDGEGISAVRKYLLERAPRMQGIFSVRRRVARLTRAELDDIVDLWVDTTLRINPRDLKLMGHLVARQNRLR